MKKFAWTLNDEATFLIEAESRDEAYAMAIQARIQLSNIEDGDEALEDAEAMFEQNDDLLEIGATVVKHKDGTVVLLVGR